MTKAALHEPLSRAGYLWLSRAADPEGATDRLGTPFRREDLDPLVEAAELHGVLPACLRALRRLSTAPNSMAMDFGLALADAIETARDKLARQAGFQLLLDHYGQRITHAMRDAALKGAIVKGPVFARRLYREPALRAFTDIDILVSIDSRDRMAPLMRALGFELNAFGYRSGKDYFEDNWLLTTQLDIMVEVHGDLVHNPALQRSLSLRYEDVLEAGDGDPEAASALLLVAGVHGAAGHQFDRLQHLVDVAQAARGAAGPIDVARLKRVAARRGATLALVTALDIADRTFREPACRDLARALSSTPLARLPARLISPNLVARARSRNRSAGSWRRKALRQVMRLASRRGGDRGRPSV